MSLERRVKALETARRVEHNKNKILNSESSVIRHHHRGFIERTTGKKWYQK